MTVMGSEDTAVNEEWRVERWRFHQLRLMGFRPVEARRINEAGVDMSVIRALRAKGCPHDTILRIVL